MRPGTYSNGATQKGHNLNQWICMFLHYMYFFICVIIKKFKNTLEHFYETIKTGWKNKVLYIGILDVHEIYSYTRIKKFYLIVIFFLTIFKNIVYYVKLYKIEPIC